MSDLRHYQDVYPSAPTLNSRTMASTLAADLLTLEYFEAEPGEMPEAVFAQHHVLLNLKEEPHRVENWRDGVHRDFTFLKDDIVVTPAGIKSGWRWHAQSRVIVITLDPDKLEKFAQSEVGVLLTDAQLKDQPQFTDADICSAGRMLYDALNERAVGYEVLFEYLARVFLVKLIQKYGEQRQDVVDQKGFTSQLYKRVLDFVADNYGQVITVEDLADKAAMSPSHFSRLFKQAIGKTPMQFVMAYRIEQAKKQLAIKDRPLTSIAIDCGFSDQAHFSRAFKQAEGMTPKKYRDSMSEAGRR